MDLKKRLKSLSWRAGLFVIVAISAYTGNIADIREIDIFQLLTIFTVTLSVYIGNEATKMINS